MNREKVVVAELLRPRGNRGEIFARSTTDVPGRLETLKHAHASLPGNSSVPVAIEDAWRHKDGWVLKLAGVDSINEAERFVGRISGLQPASAPRFPRESSSSRISSIAALSTRPPASASAPSNAGRITVGPP